MSARFVRRVHTTSRARALARVVFLCVLLSAVSLSGCIGPEWMKTRPLGPEAEVQGVVRYFVATKPGGLPEDFIHYNITLGPVKQVRDQLGTQMVEIDQGGKTIDLQYLEREKKAVQVAEYRSAKEERWEGFELSTTTAELVRRRVVGNVDGEPVYTAERIEVDVPKKPFEATQHGMVLARHAIAHGMVVDLYVELDIRKSLIVKGRDVFEHRTFYYGVSIYINDAKVGQQTFSHENNPANRRVHGDRPQVLPDVLARPTPYLEVIDPWGEEVYRPNFLHLHKSALALGTPYLFDGRESHGNMYDQKGTQVPVVEWTWDFEEGVKSRKDATWKRFDTGGVFDVGLMVRDGLDSYATTWVTMFVPYPAAEAVDVRKEARTGSLFMSTAGSALPLDPDRESLDLFFPEDLTDGVWNLGGYRIVVEFDDPLGLEEDDDLTLLRLDAASGYLKKSIEGTSPLVIETAGIPVWKGPLEDWVDDELVLDLTLLQGPAVDYTVRVEALYFGNLSRGIDSHGAHVHGAWHILQPYWDHLTPEGRPIKPYPEGFDPDDPKGKEK
ncbi:MAG: hypothetical protein KY455_09335 [Euryarchaeota archaeon]|nr:hypothetical protein [Euryarchaeota archaeon]